MTSIRGTLSSDIGAFHGRLLVCQDGEVPALQNELKSLGERIQIERGISDRDLEIYNLCRQAFNLQPLAVHITPHYVFSNPRAACLFHEIQSVDRKISKSPISYAEKKAAEKAYESLRSSYAGLSTTIPKEELDVLYREMTHLRVRIQAILPTTNAREYYLENSSPSTAILMAGIVGAVAGYFKGWVWGVAASALTLMVDKHLRNSYSAPNFLSMQPLPGLTTYHLYGSFNQDTASRVPSSQIAPGQGRNSCCVNAPFALRAMLQDKLTTQVEMDNVLKASIPAYNRVVTGYCRETGEAVQSPLLGWDCIPRFDSSIGTDLETLSPIMNPKRLDLQSGQEQNQYRELLSEMERYAADLRPGESIGGILTATLKTFAVKMTRHAGGFSYDFYDSHGGKPPRMEAYMVGFSSLDGLVNFLAEKNPAIAVGSPAILKALGYPDEVIALLSATSQDELRRANNAGIHIVRLRKEASLLASHPLAAEEALPVEPSLPRSEVRGYFHQYNISGHTYELNRYHYTPIQGHLRNVPQVNISTCASCSLAMLSHLYNNGKIDSYSLDALLAQGAKMDSDVRRLTRAQHGFATEELFASRSALVPTNLLYDRNEVPLGFQMTADRNQTQRQFAQVLTELSGAVRNPSQGPIGATLTKLGHTTALYIDRDRNGIKGIYVAESRNAFDDGVRPATSPDGAIFRPLGNDILRAAELMAGLYPFSPAPDAPQLGQFPNQVLVSPIRKKP